MGAHGIHIPSGLAMVLAGVVDRYVQLSIAGTYLGAVHAES